jgi:TPR repeat protein
VHETGVVGEIKDRARKGDDDAQFVWVALLGLGYESHLFQEEAMLTPAQAIQLLRKGADHGHVSSLKELALCHFSGRWVPQDLKEARRLWAHALALGSREAGIRLAVVEVQQPEDTVRLKGAIGVLERAAEDGSILAEVACIKHEYGVGRASTPGEVRPYGCRPEGSQEPTGLPQVSDSLYPDERRFVIDER